MVARACQDSLVALAPSCRACRWLLLSGVVVAHPGSMAGRDRRGRLVAVVVWLWTVQRQGGWDTMLVLVQVSSLPRSIDA